MAAINVLTPEDVVHYHAVLDDHRLSVSNGLCIACGVLRCEPWVDAFEHLVWAAKLVVIPHPWLLRADRSGR